jgi:hypothetical protein
MPKFRELILCPDNSSAISIRMCTFSHLSMLRLSEIATLCHFKNWSIQSFYFSMSGRGGRQAQTNSSSQITTRPIRTMIGCSIQQLHARAKTNPPSISGSWKFQMRKP